MVRATDNTIIITGGNSGLGYACAKYIARSGANLHIVLACRNEERANKAVKSIIAATGHSKISFLKLDLAQLQSVRDFVSNFIHSDLPPLNGIICNAGVALDDKTQLTVDGIEYTFQVNCLGHFLLINLLLKHMSNPARILFVSSELHRSDGPMKSLRPYYTTAKDLAHPPSAGLVIKNMGQHRYSNSKLCLLMYTYQLAERLAANGFDYITVNAFNPGLMPDTALGGLNKKLLRKWFLKYILPLFAKGAVSTPDKSGEILAQLLVSPKYANITGCYFDREKIIPSSIESKDPLKGIDLWNTSLDLLQLPENLLAKRVP